MFPGGVGHGGDAGFGGELLGGGEAGAVVAEFRENLGGIDGPAAGEALDQWAIGVLGQCGRDGGGELLELSDKRREDGDQGLDEFPAGLGLRVVGTAQGSAAQAGEQLGRGAPAAVGMALEELSEAVLAEPLSTGRRRVAGEEGQGDRGESTSAKMVAAPGQKRSSRARS
jgi:hypothetical protein